VKDPFSVFYGFRNAPSIGSSGEGADPPAQSLRSANRTAAADLGAATTLNKPVKMCQV